jgi:hypothetical protein
MTHQTNPSTPSIKWLQINLQHSRLAALNYVSQILLDLDVDVAFIQEPYATSNPNIMIKYVDEDYIQLHSLSSNHAHGAAILIKRCLKPTIFTVEIRNCVVGAKIFFRHNKLYLFSLYCRPSIGNLPSFFLNLSTSITLRRKGKKLLRGENRVCNPIVEIHISMWIFFIYNTVGLFHSGNKDLWKT